MKSKKEIMRDRMREYLSKPENRAKHNARSRKYAARKTRTDATYRRKKCEQNKKFCDENPNVMVMYVTLNKLSND